MGRQSGAVIMLLCFVLFSGPSRAAFDSRPEMYAAAKDLAFEFGVVSGIFKTCKAEENSARPEVFGGYFINWFSIEEVQNLINIYESAETSVVRTGICDPDFAKAYVRQFQTNMMNFTRDAQPFMKP